MSASVKEYDAEDIAEAEKFVERVIVDTFRQKLAPSIRRDVALKLLGALDPDHRLSNRGQRP